MPSNICDGGKIVAIIFNYGLFMAWKRKKIGMSFMNNET